MRGALHPGSGVRIWAAALSAALLGAAVWLAAATGAHAGETVTHTFNPTGGEQTFVVPVGITTIGVRAVGGTGKGGGAPAEVTGDIAVTPGQTLYVEVGGSATGQAGGFNGGGEGGEDGGGGGGGASDVRTVSRSGEEREIFKSRLIVAAGSGGGSSTGKEGGAAGAEGLPSEEGGKPGQQNHGGGAALFEECVEGHERGGEQIGGTSGKLGVGGRGESCTSKFHGGAGGGGGGAGLWGGGGGGAEFVVEGGRDFASGGGGGSSLVPEGGTLALAEGAAPAIEFTYARPESPPVVSTGEASPATGHAATAATVHGLVNPEDSTVSSCTFEYGTSVFYEHTVPCGNEAGSGDQSVAVSAAIEGLSASTTYHYRVVATNGEGTTSGADAEFVTAPHDAPTVSEFSPHAGPHTGGNTLTFTGTGMEHITRVTFSNPKWPTGEATELKHPSPTTLTAVAPPGEETMTVTLIDDLGNEAVAGSYKFVWPPSLSKISVKKGPSGGGTTVVLTGEGLGEVSAVVFGSTPVPITGEGFKTVTAVTPAHASGKYYVTVVTPGGQSEITKHATFDFANLEVTGVSPASGPLAGGTPVTITGVGFAAGTGATTFVFGKAGPATGVECASTTQCTMTAPAGVKAGTTDVRASVVGGKGKSKKVATDHFTYE